MNSFHKGVALLLGFTTKKQRRGYTHLLLNGVRYGTYSALSEDDAWSRVPSLYDLREPLEIAMIRAGYDVLVSPSFIQGTYEARLVQFVSGYNPVLTVTNHLTPTIAIAALFIRACGDGLVKPEKVELP